MQYIRDNYGEDPADYNKVTDLMILFIWWLMIWWFDDHWSWTASPGD